MSRSIHKIFFAVLAGLALSFGAGSASADIISFDLSSPNAAISPYPAPYIKVTINETGNTAVVTFDSYTTGGYTYVMGDGSSAAVNVNATSWTITGFSGTPAFATGGTLSSGGSGGVDGFGTMNQTVNSFDGYTNGYTEISFTLTNTGSTSWTLASQVLTPNGTGSSAAAHVFVCSAPCTAAAGALATGFVSNGPLAQVPIPAAAWLFGSGLLGLIAIARRRIAGTPALA
jgi:hypothetical protein